MRATAQGAIMSLTPDIWMVVGGVLAALLATALTLAGLLGRAHGRATGRDEAARGAREAAKIGLERLREAEARTVASAEQTRQNEREAAQRANDAAREESAVDFLNDPRFGGHGGGK